VEGGAHPNGRSMNGVADRTSAATLRWMATAAAMSCRTRASRVDVRPKEIEGKHGQGWSSPDRGNAVAGTEHPTRRGGCSPTAGSNRR
jgi:hypothetical protein